jgi:hypothetical protein
VLEKISLVRGGRGDHFWADHHGAFSAPVHALAMRSTSSLY